MIKDTKVSVSTLPCQDDLLANYTIKLKERGADLLHCDIMDGQFVERKTYQSDFLQKLSPVSALPLDVHLMVENPAEQVEKLNYLNIEYITFHVESFDRDFNKCMDLIQKIKGMGYKVGITTRHDTLITAYLKYLSFIDLVLIMSVPIGAGGQSFIENAYKKIEYFDNIRRENNYKYVIEVDGGITNENAKKIIDCGADILVSGSYVYKNIKNENVIKNLK